MGMRRSSVIIYALLFGITVSSCAGLFFNRHHSHSSRKKSTYAKKQYKRKQTKRKKRSLQSRRKQKRPRKGSLTDQALAKYPTRLPEVNWRHILSPEFSHGKLKGYHYRGHHLKSKRIIQPFVPKPPQVKNKHGVYQATFFYKGQKKRSTFFPDQWSIQTLKQKMTEAYNNRVSFQGNQGFVGRTKQGMNIQFWFARKKGGQIILNSAYPHYR